MERSIAAVLAVLVATCAFVSAAHAQRTLPKSLKGESVYRVTTRSPWSLEITKVNEDGTFEGLLSYSGRACNADKVPITNATNRDGVVRFNAAMGPRCSDNKFTLRAGKEHFLEGELNSSVAPDAAAIWLDPVT